MSYQISHGTILINFKRLTGKGTSHCENCIAIQARVYGPYLPATELLCIQNNKQRSVSVEHKELEVYVTGARVGPHCLVTMESYLQESQKAAEVAHKKNLLWITATRCNQDYLATHSWTGLNISTLTKFQS